MEGAQLKSEREYDLAIAGQWHGARFNALAQNGKLRSLSNYLTKRSAGKKSTLASAISFFHSMKAAGFPVEITRTPRETSDG